MMRRQQYGNMVSSVGPLPPTGAGGLPPYGRPPQYDPSYSRGPQPSGYFPPGNGGSGSGRPLFTPGPGLNGTLGQGPGGPPLSANPQPLSMANSEPLAPPTSMPPQQQQQPPSLYAHKPPPFDPFLCEQFFPKGTTDTEESALTQLLLKQHQEITPTTQEQNAVSGLLSKIKFVLDKIVVAPESFTAMGIEEVREVGSWKKGTMLTEHSIADIAVILKTLPTVESVNALGQMIVKDLKESDRLETYGFVVRDFGCEIAATQAVVRLLITILPQSAKLLEPDLHLPERVLQSNMATIRHARWFEEHATHSSIKVLIRLIKFVCNKFEGLRPLNTWCIEVLSHYCVLNTPSRTPLPLSLAFRRFFQMLSSGIFLPHSPGLVDPCDAHSRVHFTLSLEEMDIICSTAQTLLRIMLHGGVEQILSADRHSTAIATDMNIWGQVVVTPLERAYSIVDLEPYCGDVDEKEKSPKQEVDENVTTTDAAAGDGQKMMAMASVTKS